MKICGYAGLTRLFDDIGNRTSTAVGGDQWDANLRYANYSANTLNQYTSRTVPGAADVIGVATNTATVTVNNQPTFRKGTYYRAQLALTNSAGAVYEPVTNLAVLNRGGTNQDILTNITGNLFLPQNPENFTYDADGNLTQDGRWTYSWDAENRLINLTSLSSSPAASKLKLDFAYDWKSRRIQKLVSTNNGTGYVASYTNSFVYDRWNLTAELNEANSALIRNYVWGSDVSGTTGGAGGVGGLLTISSSTSVQYVSFDANGNVASLANATDGTIAAQYEYGPFGEAVRTTGPLAKANPFRFSTKYEDDETDLHYYGYRYYPIKMGRWLNDDPIGENGGLNLYGFVANAPINLVDKLGLIWPFTKTCSCCCCAEDVQIRNVHPVQKSFSIGHGFDTVIKLKYVAGPHGDCTLKWLEKTARPYNNYMLANSWNDMTKNPATEASFDETWGKRLKPCPGTETVTDYDEPKYSSIVARSVGSRRILQFDIIILSAANCPCKKKQVEVTATQVIDYSEDPPTQDFTTP